MRRRPDVANQPAGSGKRQRGEIDTAEADLPAGRRSEPRQQLRHQILAAIAWPDQRDMSAERETEAESIEQADAVAVDQADIAEFDRWDMPKVDPTTMQSTLPHVFFGGDAAFGPKNIIWAVSSRPRKPKR